MNLKFKSNFLVLCSISSLCLTLLVNLMNIDKDRIVGIRETRIVAFIVFVFKSKLLILTDSYHKEGILLVGNRYANQYFRF